MKEKIHDYDISNIDSGGKFNISVTKSILGRMIDEYPSDIILSFYGTGSKAYHIS